MYDICCIGHITLDKIITPGKEVYMPGGTSFYFSNAIRHMELRYHLLTSLAETELHFIEDLRKKSISISVLPSRYTVNFENRYAENQDQRTQRVLQQADPFTVDSVKNIEADYFHLGPLLANDISLEIIKVLADKAKLSLDVQGLLREVRDEKVYPANWQQKKEALPYISILKANAEEMEILTGQPDIREGARILAGWGVAEVVITLGSKGSVIYAGGNFFNIPAYEPLAVIDATGCGDTYMAGYLSQRIHQNGIQTAGEFAAAMATSKIEVSGPFTGNQKDIENLLLQNRRKVFP